MPPDTTCPDTFSKPIMKSDFRSIGWTNLMTEFLMGTEIFENNENGREKPLNPNIVMDVRHKMVKQHSGSSHESHEQIHTKALEFLRTENYKRLRKQREGKLVEKEIARLKQILENHRLLTKKKFDDTSKRTNSSANAPTLSKNYTKLKKRVECYNGTCEVDTWISQSLQMTMETKISPQGIPFDVKVSLKRQEVIEEYSERVSTRKGSVIDDEIEHQKDFWEEDEGKNEIMRRFFEKGLTEVKPEAQSVKKKINTRRIPEIQNKMNQRRIEHAWMTWKTYIDQLKTRRREKTIYTGKIEAFLSKLQEAQIIEMKNKKLKQAMTKKEEIRKNLFDKAKIRNKQLNNGRNEENLKKVMEEIKASRTEAVNTLREITKTNVENQKMFRNVKFLQRMEERKEERIKRRQEIQEKKRLLEEEREKALKQKEDKEKQKKLEELKERRRLEKERMEEQKREREILKLKMSVAESHYKNHLLLSRGLRPWMMLMKMKDLQQQQAVEFFERRLTHKMFRKWAIYVRQETELKERRADELYQRILKKNYFRNWMEFYREKMEQNQVAVDWNEFRTTERAFQKWLRFTMEERFENINRNNIAVLKYEQKLKMKYLKKLRDYPELKKLEQAKENRKRKWRQKVKEILPDFQPTEISECS